MTDRSAIGFEDALGDRLGVVHNLSARLSVVESNYASREYVVEVRWQVVKWLVGVAFAGVAVGAAVVTLFMRI